MEHIQYEVTQGVAFITLGRPKVFNSFNRDMALEMQAALDNAAEDTAIRAICISGEGKAFCAGQDLAEIVAPDGPPLSRIVGEHYNPIVIRLRQIEKPIVAAVNGVAAGAGANIALACDITIATESASFIQAFSKIGLIPDSGGTYFLPRIIGMQKAAALMFTGDKVSAKDAEAMGMIYKAVADDQFMEFVRNFCFQLATMPTKGLAYTKRLLNASYNHSLQEQLQMEDDLQTLAGNTHDYREGVNAFLEKRKPTFLGK
jgi:2-(1,2-epoxy-1,2-dihydrophenyl)acetyl-CoA isomerase